MEDLGRNTNLKETGIPAERFILALLALSFILGVTDFVQGHGNAPVVQVTVGDMR